MISSFINYILTLDQHLQIFVADYGIAVYFLLFSIIFIETGIVIAPFLPGDSLLFAAGALAALKSLDIIFLLPLLILAAILGDTANYWIGRTWGSTLAAQAVQGNYFIRQAHLQRTREFYARHGKETIILARFVPIVRTFAPFIAGIAQMRYKNFFAYNIIGGILWVTLFVLGGYLFGNIPFVQEHFSLLILAIILLSFIPLIQFGRKKQG